MLPTHEEILSIVKEINGKLFGEYVRKNIVENTPERHRTVVEVVSSASKQDIISTCNKVCGNSFQIQNIQFVKEKFYDHEVLMECTLVLFKEEDGRTVEFYICPCVDVLHILSVNMLMFDPNKEEYSVFNGCHLSVDEIIKQIEEKKYTICGNGMKYIEKLLKNEGYTQA